MKLVSCRIPEQLVKQIRNISMFYGMSYSEVFRMCLLIGVIQLSNTDANTFIKPKKR